jgi:preprotein translocase subunit SecE
MIRRSNEDDGRPICAIVLSVRYLVYLSPLVPVKRDRCVLGNQGTIKSMSKESEKLRLSKTGILDTLRAIEWSGAKRVVELLFVVVITLLAASTFTGLFDNLLLQSVTKLKYYSTPSWVRLPAAAALCASMITFGYLSRLHQGPGGDIASVFNATADRTGGSLTPTQRRNQRLSMITLTLVLFFSLLTWLSW